MTCHSQHSYLKSWKSKHCNWYVSWLSYTTTVQINIRSWWKLLHFFPISSLSLQYCWTLRDRNSPFPLCYCIFYNKIQAPYRCFCMLYSVWLKIFAVCCSVSCCDVLCLCAVGIYLFFLFRFSVPAYVTTVSCNLSVLINHLTFLTHIIRLV